MYTAMKIIFAGVVYAELSKAAVLVQNNEFVALNSFLEIFEAVYQCKPPIVNMDIYTRNLFWNESWCN